MCVLELFFPLRYRDPKKKRFRVLRFRVFAAQPTPSFLLKKIFHYSCRRKEALLAPASIIMVRPLLVVSLSLWLSLSLCRGVVSVFSAHDAHFLSNDIPKSGGSFKSCLWGNFQRGENKFLHLPRVLYSILFYISLSLSRVSTRSHGLLSLSLSLSSNARRSSRTRSKKPRYFPSCFPAATGSTRREIPRKRRKQKRRRRRNSGGHSRLP